MHIGIRGFHAEKIVMAVLRKVLECSAIENIFVTAEIYGPSAVKQVFDGGHYSRSKRGLSIIAEGLEALRLISF